MIGRSENRALLLQQFRRKLEFGVASYFYIVGDAMPEEAKKKTFNTLPIQKNFFLIEDFS